MEKEFLTLLERGIYVEKEDYDKRGIVVFDDNYLDVKPKFIDYEKLLSHIIDSVTKALMISNKNKVSGTFVMFIRLNPTRKNTINKRSMINIISILSSMYKKNLYKCVFYNTNKYFRVIYGTIKPILDNSLKKKFLFMKTTETELKHNDTQVV